MEVDSLGVVGRVIAVDGQRLKVKAGLGGMVITVKCDDAKCI